MFTYYVNNNIGVKLELPNQYNNSVSLNLSKHFAERYVEVGNYEIKSV